MLAKRLVALVLAVSVVVVAFVVRDQLIDDDDTEAVGQVPVEPGDTQAPSEPSGASEQVICVNELAAACEDVEGAQVEPAGLTAARLATGDASPTTWVTLAPWPAIVDRQRSAADLPAVFGDAAAVASSPLVLAARQERFGALEQSCGGVTWRCVGDRAGRPWAEAGGDRAWGEVKPAHDSPVDSAVGLLALASVVEDYYGGRTDLAAIDLETDDQFLSWLQRFERATPRLTGAATVLERLLTTPEVDVVGTTDAVLGGVGATALAGARPVGEPTADVVVAVPAGEDVPEELVDRVEESLIGDGWQPPAGEPGVTLPSPDLLISLQEIWKAVAG